MTNTGGGILQIASSSNTFAGAVVVNAASTLQIASSSSTFTGPVLVNAGATLQMPNSVNTFSGTLTVSNGAALQMLNSTGAVVGTVTFSGGNNSLSVTNSALSVPALTTSGGANTLTISSNGSLVANGAVTLGGADSMTAQNGSVAVGSMLLNGNGNTLSLTNAQLWTTALFSPFGATSSNSTFIVGTNSTWDLGGQGGVANLPFSIASGAGAARNTLRIDGGVVTNVYLLNVGAANATQNVLVVTNGGRLYVAGKAGNNFSYVGAGGGGVASVSNALIVTGNGSLWDAGGNGVRGNYSPVCRNNQIRIENGGTFANVGAFTLGFIGAESESMIVSNNAHVYSVGAPTFYLLDDNGNGTPNNNTSLTIVGGPDGNSVWNMAGGLLQLIKAAVADVATNNSVTLQNGGIITNAGALTVMGSTCGANAYGNAVIITNGGQLYTTAASTPFASATAPSNTILVTGANSLWDIGNQTLTLGLGISNVVRIDQGGRVDNVGSLALNAAVSKPVDFRGGTLGVSAVTDNSGFLFTAGDGSQPALLKGLGGSLAFNNGLLISSNAVLRVGGSVSGGATGVILTNGATLSPGLSGPAALMVGGSNLTWCGGGTLVCEIADFQSAPGVGWDVVNVSSQLTLTAGGPVQVVKLDSMGINAANFATNADYNLLIATAMNLTGFGGGRPTLDVSAFSNAFTGVWGLSVVANNLYLTYRGAPTYAASNVWDHTKSGGWNTSGNWTNNAVPQSGASTILEFGGTNGEAAYYASNDVANPFQLDKMLLTSSNTATNTILGSALQFTAAGSGIEQSGTGVFVVSNRVSLAATGRFWGPGVGTVTLASNVTGSAGLAKEGSWMLALAASNAFAGPVTVNGAGGALRIDKDGALGTTNDVTVFAGTLLINASSTFGSNVVQSNRRLTVAGLGATLANSSAFTVGSMGATNVTMTVSNGAAVNQGAAFTLGDRVTNMTLTVSGSNTLWNGGAQAINILGRANALNVSNGAVVSNVTLNLWNGSVSNAVTVSNGGRVYVVGGTAVFPDNYAVVTITDPGSIMGFVTANQGFEEGRGGVGQCSVIVSNSGVLASTLAGDSLFVGSSSPGTNSLTVTTGGMISNISLRVGNQPNPGSWTYGNSAVFESSTSYPSAVYVGNLGRYGTLTVRNGGMIRAGGGGTAVANSGMDSYNLLWISTNGAYNCAAGGVNVGGGATTTWNRLVVDAGVMTNIGTGLRVGGNAVATPLCGFNSVSVTNSGLLTLDGAAGCVIGNGSFGYSNILSVAAGGTLNARGNPISLSSATTTGAWDNALIVGPGGTVANVGTLTVGNALTTNQLRLSGGSLTATNLVAMNANNTVSFPAGTLNVQTASVSNGLPLIVGDGVQSNATLNLLAGGSSLFANGLAITNGAVMTGAGRVAATTDVYGTLSPGPVGGVGVLTNTGTLTLRPGCTTVLAISTNTTAGAGWDLQVVEGPLTVGGQMNVVFTGAYLPLKSNTFLVMTNTTADVITGSFSGNAIAYTNADCQPKTSIGAFTITVADHSVMLQGFHLGKIPGTVYTVR